jgi:hypothetical protein
MSSLLRCPRCANLLAVYRGETYCPECLSYELPDRAEVSCLPGFLTDADTSLLRLVLARPGIAASAVPLRLRSGLRRLERLRLIHYAAGGWHARGARPEGVPEECPCGSGRVPFNLNDPGEPVCWACPACAARK